MICYRIRLKYYNHPMGGITMKKKIISLSLASALLMSTVACASGSNDKQAINETDEKEVINEEMKEESTYITHSGKINEVLEDGKNFSITVNEKEMLNETSEPQRGAINFNISEEVVVMSNKTQEFIDMDKLVEGSVVEVIYRKDEPMTRSLPPMTNPEVVILKDATEEEEKITSKIDIFDEDLLSSDNSLKINITEDTLIVDKDENELDEKDIYNKELLVSYGPAVTMSIPAQSNAVKIVVLDEENEAKTQVSKITYEGKEIVLKEDIYESEDTLMIPMRKVGESLGYKISWNSKANQAELTKGTNMVTATINEDMYSFSKMIVKLGKASEVKDNVTFIPVSFLDEVMQLDVEETEDGVLNIK